MVRRGGRGWGQSQRERKKKQQKIGTNKVRNFEREWETERESNRKKWEKQRTERETVIKINEQPIKEK